jgi:hypothetical protein
LEKKESKMITAFVHFMFPARLSQDRAKRLFLHSAPKYREVKTLKWDGVDLLRRKSILGVTNPGMIRHGPNGISSTEVL